MHIANDYYGVVDFVIKEIKGNDLMCGKELLIRFADKYKDLLVENEQLKSQQEKNTCQMKKQQNQLKLLKSKKKAVKKKIV